MRVEERSIGPGALGTSVDDLYRRHAGEALRVARSITHNADDAADAVAEAFAGVLRAHAGGRLAEPEAFRPYLLAATRNASIDILRKTGRVRPTDEAGTLDGAADTAGPSDRLVAGEDQALVAEAFAELPPRWRAVLWLTEVEALTPRDAASLLGVTPNNVSQLAVRARGRLRERYVQMHVRNHATGACREVTEQLGALVAGRLTTVQADRVHEHLAECAECRGRLAELEDLGLTLRRAAIPVHAVLLERVRHWRWPRRTRGGGSRASTWVGRIDPSVSTGVAGLVHSPAVQQVAASVGAGLLVLALGAAVVRHNDRPRVDAGRPGVDLAAPAPTVPVAAVPTPEVAPASEPLQEPATTTSTTVTTTTTTTPPSARPTTAPAVASPGSEAPRAFVPRGPLAVASSSLVAHALVPDLAIYDGPGSATPSRELANPRPSGAPLVVLVTEQRDGWLQVLLPVRPNGSTGWIRTADVRLVAHDFRIVIELGEHRLTAYQGTEVLLSEPIGVGTAAAPTPGGLYYTTELFEPLDAAGNVDRDGPYGAYAYGLSGFSEVLFEFAGGDGQFGIHGTNDPSGLGRDVSHGCIRMSNAGITQLARTLPLGVPVEILP